MTDFKGHSHGEYQDDCPICYLDREVERLSAKVETKELARKAALKTIDSLTARKAALSAENERTKEQCAREHKSREHWIAVAQRLEAALEDLSYHLANPVYSTFFNPKPYPDMKWMGDVIDKALEPVLGRRTHE